MKKALFVCYGGGHADALIPVIQHIRNSNSMEVEVIGINLAVEKLRRNGIPCKSLSSYLDVRSVEVGFEIAKKKHNFNSLVSFADSIAYYGFTMVDLIDDVGEEKAFKILEIFDRRTMFPYKTMIRILNIEKPDVVVVTTMNRFSATLYAASCLHIPSLKVEDLIGKIYKTYPDKIQVSTLKEKHDLISRGISEKDIILKNELQVSSVLDYSNKIYNLQLNLRPTISAVFCNYAKKELVTRGIPSETIIVTGQPAFDKHPLYLKNTCKVDVFNKMNLDVNEKLIVFMSQPLVEREEVLRLLLSALTDDSLRTFQFVIKLHPNEDGKIHRMLLENYNLNNVFILKDIDVRELIAVSDLIITVSSTTGLEAAVMGKSLLYINISDKVDDIPFDKMNIGIKCTNSKELIKNINKVLSDTDRYSTDRFNEYKSDSKAALRVANLIEFLAENKTLNV